MTNKKKLLISFNLNILIIVLTIIGMGVAVIDVRGHNVSYASMFKYFTTLSNLFLFVAATIMFVYQAIIIAGKLKVVPKWVYIVKLSATTSTTITMFVVIFFLTPMAAMGQLEGVTPGFLYVGSNLNFHVLSPIVGIVTFLLFETNHEIKLPQTLFALIFVGAYEIFYTTNIYIPFVPGEPDWYGFGKIPSLIPVVLIGFLAIAFLLSWLLWLGNRKINIFKERKTATK